MVRFSADAAAGATLGNDVDVTAGDAVAPTPRALSCWPSDFALPRASAVALGEGDEIVSVAATGVGDFDVACFGVALGVDVLGDGQRPAR